MTAQAEGRPERPPRPRLQISESLYVSDRQLLVPAGLTRGPWDPGAQHGGAPAALLTSAMEQLPGAEGMAVGRISVELTRPVPIAPLELRAEVLRRGRRVQELAAELRHEGETVCRARALRVRAVAPEVHGAAAPAPAERRMPAPEAVPPLHFALDDEDRESFAGTAIEMRSPDTALAPGPARVWMRLRAPLVDGRPVSPLALAAAVADFGNGVSAALPFARYLFINADLTLHLQRPPSGEWVGLAARTLLDDGGSGLAESVLHDRNGPFGRAFQTLVVEPR